MTAPPFNTGKLPIEYSLVELELGHSFVDDLALLTDVSPAGHPYFSVGKQDGTVELRHLPILLECNLLPIQVGDLDGVEFGRTHLEEVKEWGLPLHRVVLDVHGAGCALAILTPNHLYLDGVIDVGAEPLLVEDQVDLYLLPVALELEQFFVEDANQG